MLFGLPGRWTTSARPQTPAGLPGEDHGRHVPQRHLPHEQAPEVPGSGHGQPGTQTDTSATARRRAEPPAAGRLARTVPGSVWFFMLIPRVLLGCWLVVVGFRVSLADDRGISVGTWYVGAVVVNGNEVDSGRVTMLQVDYREDGSWRVRVKGLVLAEGTSSNDDKQSPKTFEMETLATEPSKSRKYSGIYRGEGDTRQLCFVDAGMPRPDAFTSPRGSGRVLVTLTRAEREP